MCSREPRLFPTIRSDFARLIARKFAPARLLFVGNEAVQFSEQGRKDGLESTGCAGSAELEALRQNQAGRALISPSGFIRPRSSRPATARCSSA